jgi:RNA polymerase sigma-70 factor (ECF subfamily)
LRRATPARPAFDASSGDVVLIEAAQQGNLDAFNFLVERHERAVYTLCFRMLGGQAEAEDAAQDTFIRAWQAVGTFKGVGFRPWLLRIATNRCYDRLRTLSRHRTTSLRSEDDDAEIDLPDPDTASDLPAQAERRELSILLQEALDHLPVDQRIAIVLCDVQQYTYEEAAGIAGVPAGTLKSRASRGRERLRLYLRSLPESRELFEHIGRSFDE